MSLTVVESDTLTVDSGPLTSEDQPILCDADSKKEQGICFYLHPQIKLAWLFKSFPNKITYNE